jgi:antibiotic biosynthesis monooxygenase (ABM) superfamily enzyme
MNETFSAPSSVETSASGHQPAQIGGWLIVVAIGLIISLAQNLSGLLQSLTTFRGSVWERLTDPSSPSYHPNWRGALIYEAVAAGVYLIMNIILIILFFRKQRLFPVLTVIFIPSIFVLSLVAHYLAGQIPAVAESPSYAQGFSWLATKFVALHIWIPYLLVSKRVKATFIR